MSVTPVASVHRGTNAGLIAEVARLYPLDGVVADVTFGKGNFWRTVDLSATRLLASDVDPYAERHRGWVPVLRRRAWLIDGVRDHARRRGR